MTKRFSIFIMCLLVLAATVLADDRIELTVWGASFDFRGKRAAILKFEKAHPHIRVVTSIPGRAMDDQKLMCGIAAGSPPDVIRQDRFTISDWAARGTFMPLGDLVKRDRDTKCGIHPEEFFTACWDEVVYKNEIFAIPDSVDNRALYVNCDLLQRARLVDKDGKARPPRTWTELRDYANRLTARDDRGNILRVGFIPNYGNSWLYMYGWQNGGQFMSPDRTRCTLNDPPIVEALQFMVNIYDDLGGVSKVDAFATSFQGGELDPFFTGKVAMKIDGSWVLSNIADNAPNLNFGVAPAPVPEGRPFISWSGGFSLAIPVGARHPKEAWEFIKWMVSEEEAMIEHTVEDKYYRSRGTPYIPTKHPNRRISEMIYETFVAHNSDISANLREGYRVFMDLMPKSKFRPVTPVGQLLWDEHVRAFNLATHHVYSPAESLDLGRATVQEELDKILKKRVYPPFNWWGVVVPAVGIGALLGIALSIRLRDRRVRGRVLRRETAAGIAFAMPWFVGILLFTGGPIIVSIIFSFCEYDVVHPARCVGLENYRKLLTADPLFWKSLWNTIFMVLGVPIGMAVGLAIAMLLDSDVRGMSTYRTVYYLPAIVPAVANSILWIWVLNPTDGLINSALRMVGLRGPLWLQSEVWAKPAIILMGLWGAGASMIIWLAGLKGIPEHLYEAAEIDGAGPVQKFIHVTLPMLTPYIFFNLIMGIIHTFQVFTQAFVMTQGGPADATLFYVYYLFNNAFRFFRMGYASAMAWILFVIVLTLTIIQLKLAPRWVHYEQE
ncbi:MAG: extracellular solute-binding protein [Planctomycetota bacterium]